MFTHPLGPGVLSPSFRGFCLVQSLILFLTFVAPSLAWAKGDNTKLAKAVASAPALRRLQVSTAKEYADLKVGVVVTMDTGTGKPQAMRVVSRSSKAVAAPGLVLVKVTDATTGKTLKPLVLRVNDPVAKRKDGSTVNASALNVGALLSDSNTGKRLKIMGVSRVKQATTYAYDVRVAPLGKSVVVKRTLGKEESPETLAMAASFSSPEEAEFAALSNDPTEVAAGLYYLRARYYDPSTGRFLSRDPVAGNPRDPTTLHPYAYVGNDPINKVDPSGQSAILSFGFGSAGSLTGSAVRGSSSISTGSAIISQIKFYFNIATLTSVLAAPLVIPFDIAETDAERKRRDTVEIFTGGLVITMPWKWWNKAV